MTHNKETKCRKKRDMISVAKMKKKKKDANKTRVFFSFSVWVEQWRIYNELNARKETSIVEKLFLQLSILPRDSKIYNRGSLAKSTIS